MRHIHIVRVQDYGIDAFTDNVRPISKEENDKIINEEIGEHQDLAKRIIELQSQGGYHDAVTLIRQHPESHENTYIMALYAGILDAQGYQVMAAGQPQNAGEFFVEAGKITEGLLGKTDNPVISYSLLTIKFDALRHLGDATADLLHTAFHTAEESEIKERGIEQLLKCVNTHYGEAQDHYFEHLQQQKDALVSQMVSNSYNLGDMYTRWAKGLGTLIKPEGIMANDKKMVGIMHDVIHLLQNSLVFLQLAKQLHDLYESDIPDFTVNVSETLQNTQLLYEGIQQTETAHRNMYHQKGG